MIRECLPRLANLGISWDDALELRRIAMTLHRWHEMECGDSNNYASWSITRGKKDNGGAFEYDDTGRPYLERHFHDQPAPRYELIADRERGALKRLGKIMAKYPQYTAYVQTDPRGAPLYILARATTPEPYDQFYNRGTAVYR